MAVALVATPSVVNAITPRPFVGIFRALIGQVDDSVQLGPYKNDTKQVTASRTVFIPVEGAPDAGLTMYSTSDATAEPKPVVLLIHGGGWVVGRASQIASYAKLLASRGFVVANLDYSLAPEHIYPTPVRQAAAALDYLHKNADDYGGNSSELFVGGNSAGAQIAGQLGDVVTNPSARKAVRISTSTPKDALRGVILFSGPYDFATVERDNFPAFGTYAWSYTGQKNWQEFADLDQLSVTHNATAEYPATYITAGDADPLEPQTYELDAVLRAHGVDVTSRYWTGTDLDLPHDYVYDLRTKAARTAFSDTVSFIEDHAQ